MVKRRPPSVPAPGRLCAYCNGSDVVLEESRNVRRPQDWFNRHWHDHLRRYERCNDCGARLLLSDDVEPVRTMGPATSANGTAIRVVNDPSVDALPSDHSQ